VTAEVVAWEAERAARAAAEAAARAAEAGRRTRGGGGRSGAAVAAGGGSGSIADVAASTLAGLPGGGGVRIIWDPAWLGNHLGGVMVGGADEIALNSSRLAGKPGRTTDVIRHEIAHIYQSRLIRRAVITVDDLEARLSTVFGSNGLEKSADCVALRFGASWVNYTSSCSGEKQTWVDALIGGYLP
jgi:hypothetical protein